MPSGAAALLVAGAVAAAALWRRRRRGRREHVDLYFADGSMISLEEEREEARRLLPLAHEVLSASRA